MHDETESSNSELYRYFVVWSSWPVNLSAIIAYAVETGKCGWVMPQMRDGIFTLDSAWEVFQKFV